MKQPPAIEIGQRFQSVGTLTGEPIFTYEVQAIFRSRVDQVEYARLVRVDERTQQKSVATEALLNRRIFIPLPANGQAISA